MEYSFKVINPGSLYAHAAPRAHRSLCDLLKKRLSYHLKGHNAFFLEMILIRELSLGFLCETLGMSLLQLGFSDFFSSFFGVMEMNMGLEQCKKSQQKTGRWSLKYLIKIRFACVLPKYEINRVKVSDDVLGRENIGTTIRLIMSF